MTGNALSLAGALLVLFTVLQGLSRWCAKFLPLGGSHVSQLGIVLGIAFVIVEMARIFG